MNLSMWEIYNGLHMSNVVPMIQSGSATIEQARLIASSYLNDKTVYVGRSNNYFESADEDTLIVHRDDMILVHGVDVENVFNEICSIMESYNRWEAAIARLETEEDGLQQMLDESKEIIKAPCYVYAPDGRAFAIANGYPHSIHWHWAEILDTRGISSERIRNLRDSINLPEVWKDTFPKVRDSEMGDHQYLHCSLYPNGYMAGHFVVFGFTRPFDKGLERLMEILVAHMTRHMENYYAHYSPTSKLAESFARFFEKGSFEEAEVALSLRALRWKPDDTFRLYVIREHGEQPVLLARLYQSITNRNLFSIAFTFGGRLVVLENESRQTQGPLLDSIETLLGGDFCCGVSMPFDNLRQFLAFYQQANNEAERCVAGGMCVSQAHDHRIDQFRTALRNDVLLRTYALQELIKLARYDRVHGTQYYQTLRACVVSSFHLSDAARFLGIHRNSLTYRLEKMHEITDLHLVDKATTTYDPEEFNYLLLSYAVIDAYLSDASEQDLL